MTLRLGCAAGKCLQPTAAEVVDAPARVRELHQDMLVLAGSVLVLTPEVGELVTAYEARKILVAKYTADMRHIAWPRSPRSTHSSVGTSSTSCG